MDQKIIGASLREARKATEFADRVKVSNTHNLPRQMIPRADVSPLDISSNFEQAEGYATTHVG
jgi:hypothetical protein